MGREYFTCGVGLRQPISANISKERLLHKLSPVSRDRVELQPSHVAWIAASGRQFAAQLSNYNRVKL